jgi:hypothetical protein
MPAEPHGVEITCAPGLGRKLTAADFADAHINTTDKLRRSPRLRDRLRN